MATAARADTRRRQTNRDCADARRKLIRFLSLSVALPAMLACPARANKWDIVPTLEVRETYTDNLSLTPDVTKEADWITQVIPAISITTTGPRLRFNLNYAPEITYYAQEKRDNTIFQRGGASLNAELASKLLFFDAGAKIDQYNTSTQGPITTSNINTTGNLTTVRTFFVSPYVLRDVGSAARVELRYSYSDLASDDQTALSNSQGNRVNLRLSSGPAYKLLTWELSYDGEVTSYESQLETDFQVVSAKARRLLTSTVGLLLEGGYDYYKSGEFAPVSEGPSWSAGFDWTPSPRTRLALTTGQRFYGDTYFLDFRHRTRLTVWTAGYTQDVTDTRSEFFVPGTSSTAGYLDALYSTRFPDPVARQKVVEDFIARTGLPPSLSSPINFFTTQLFLEKRWHASVSWLGVSNVVIANLFDQTREGLVGDLVLPTAPEAGTQTGGSLLWNWRMTARNALNLGGSYSRNETPNTGQVDKLSYVGASISRRFQPRLTGTLGYRRQQNDSNVSALSYTENAGYASLRMTF